MRDTEFLGAGDPGALEGLIGGAQREGAAAGLAEAWRRFGWQRARLDPLGHAPPPEHAELDPCRWGLAASEADHLRAAYAGTIGWQVGHIQDDRRRAWLAEQAEGAWQATQDARQRALDLIARGELFEAVLDRRLPGTKTFGLSGAEGYLVLLEWVLNEGLRLGYHDAVMGGMHRGRLTQMGLIFGKPLERIVADAMGVPEFSEDLGASSDSPYHLGWQGSVRLAGGDLNVWVAPHPSHLSIVAPVGQGYARALRDAGSAVLPLALHTDAAFAGQGVCAEMLQLSGLPPFSVGGTIHLILNNQIGFTTGAEEARTARTPADSARMLDIPILHVNGDDPDAVMRVAEVAVAWRERFNADIVVDLVSVRRKGHNEIDQPSFTQPRMYREIAALSPLSERYASRIGRSPSVDAFRTALDKAFDRGRNLRSNERPHAPGLCEEIETRLLDPVETGVDAAHLVDLGHRLTAVPAGIVPHDKVAEFLSNRRRSIDTDAGIDWATAEALAFAACLDGGTPVRLIGQDTVRGAFSQRHLAIHCQTSDRVVGILDAAGWRGCATIANSPLTEAAVVAFEHGYSIAQNGSALQIWEAQFGDFMNVAQSVFDQFIVCAEDRWLLTSNLVLLLPHGVDGGGPDHATAHPERLLSACARGNIQVANPSTPANYFHLLRRQCFQRYVKPLVILAPKTLLRHPAAKSRLSAFQGHFRTVVAETRPATRIVMSTGKLAVLLEQERDRRGVDVALVRLEQLYPLDTRAIAAAVAQDPEATLVWAQEEPENLGFFNWLDRRLETATGRRWHLVSRPASPSASSGPKSWDDAHLSRVISEALEGAI